MNERRDFELGSAEASLERARSLLDDLEREVQTLRRRESRRRAKPVERSGGDLRIYFRLLRQARPFWRHIAGILLLGLAATPLALLAPVPLKIAVDTVIGTRPLPSWLGAVLPGFAQNSTGALLFVAAVLLLLIAIINQVRSLSEDVLGAYTGERLVLDFRSRLFRHVQRLSLGFHDARGTTDSLYRIQYDAPAIQWIAVYGVSPFVTAGFTLAGMIAITAMLDWQLALVALGITPVLFLLTRAFRRRLRRGWTVAKELESSALTIVQETLGALRVVKAFGAEDREQERFTSRSRESARAHVKMAAADGALALLIGVTTAVGTATVLYIGVRHVRAGTLTLGELLLVMGYLAQLYAPLQTISQSIATLQSSLASAERAFTLLDAPTDVPESRDARPLARAEGRVRFKNVWFEYEPDRPVLNGIDFEIEPGMRVGVAGATGAGKTTLVNLMTRFYDPTSGRILLDGVDVRDYRLADLRNQFAIVLQEPVLFSTTIAENIAYARPEATMMEICEAASAANAHDFIAALPDGYETRVGERGMRLSGGERQRISLARAFLKDAPLLLLDEPTSSVDMRTEQAIVDAMERLMRGRTTIMIAHRLSTLEYCDLVLELEHGRLLGIREGVSELALARA